MIQARCDDMGIVAMQIVQYRDTGVPYGQVQDRLAAIGDMQSIPALIKKDYFDLAAFLYARPDVDKLHAQIWAQKACHRVWAQALGSPAPGTAPTAPPLPPSAAMRQEAATIRREVYGQCGEDVYLRYVKTEDSADNLRRYPFRIKQYHGLTMQVEAKSLPPSDQAAGYTEFVEVAFHAVREREWLPSHTPGWLEWNEGLSPLGIPVYVVFLARKEGRILRVGATGRKGTAVACTDVPQ
jgi:hypothetical protein